MKEIKTIDYVKRVLLIMNEAGMSDIMGNTMLGADTAQVDKYIAGSYVDAWRQCVKVMPRNWFENESFKTNTHKPDLPNGTGYIELKEDFYLLSMFKMEGWVKPVFEAFIENDKTSSIQSNEYTRGSTVRPACTISQKIVQKMNEVTNKMEDTIINVLNYYSLPQGLLSHVIETAIYVPSAKPILNIDDKTKLILSDQVIEPLAYLSAATVFTMFEKYDISNALEKRAIAMFPGLQSVRGTNVTTKQ